MNVSRIVEILRDCLGNEGEDGVQTIDVWMEVQLRTDKVREYANEMSELLKDWPSESWGQPVPPLGEEINYLTAGGVLGDQGLAFILFAFGKLLGWWVVIEPTILGLKKDDKLAQELAGKGYISIEGYKPTNVNQATP